MVFKLMLVNYFYGIGVDVEEKVVEVYILCLCKWLFDFGVEIYMVCGVGYMIKESVL